MSKEKKDELVGKVIFGKYKVLNFLSKGGFSRVYKAQNIKDYSYVAIKAENKKNAFLFLENECTVLLTLKGIGIPKVISYGLTKKYNLLIEELLGMNLSEIYMKNKKHLPLKEVCLIGLQILDRLEFIHEKGYIHRDLKPDNFHLGNPNISTIYLIDFGLAKKYKSSLTGNHKKFSKAKIFFGSFRYASINTLEELEQSRRDDLESLGYVLIYLLAGKLPWQEYEKNEGKLIENKKKVTVENLCNRLPKEFKEYIYYTRSLKFEEDPNYDYLRGLIKNIISKYLAGINLTFYWDNSNIISLDKLCLQKIKKHSPSPRMRLLNNIKKSLEKKKGEKKELSVDMVINKKEKIDNKNKNFSNNFKQLLLKEEKKNNLNNTEKESKLKEDFIYKVKKVESIKLNKIEIQRKIPFKLYRSKNPLNFTESFDGNTKDKNEKWLSGFNKSIIGLDEIETDNNYNFEEKISSKENSSKANFKSINHIFGSGNKKYNYNNTDVRKSKEDLLKNNIIFLPFNKGSKIKTSNTPKERNDYIPFAKKIEVNTTEFDYHIGDDIFNFSNENIEKERKIGKKLTTVKSQNLKISYVNNNMNNLNEKTKINPFPQKDKLDLSQKKLYIDNILGFYDSNSSKNQYFIYNNFNSDKENKDNYWTNPKKNNYLNYSNTNNIKINLFSNKSNDKPIHFRQKASKLSSKFA